MNKTIEVLREIQTQAGLTHYHNALQVAIDAIKERDKFKQALEDIIKHQELIAGDAVRFTTVYNIAKKVLED